MIKLKLKNIVGYINQQEKIIDDKYRNWLHNDDVLKSRLKDVESLIKEIKRKISSISNNLGDERNFESLSKQQQWDVLFDE